ncbi:hypothetical protein F5884DRAFT_217590 [Xylogone sp. PMI_703]|nr:hypothetical protein F5884DRAFT_217590 [Xylogone sp. PMI_703]
MYYPYSPSPPSTSYTTGAMEIPGSSSRSRSTSGSCAFPSWPRRSSLDSSAPTSPSEETLATSYISDEDLFPCVFDESEPEYSPISTPNSILSPTSPSAYLQEEEAAPAPAFDFRALQQQYLKAMKAPKKEKKSRRSSSKKSRGTVSRQMSPIMEVGE